MNKTAAIQLLIAGMSKQADWWNPTTWFKDEVEDPRQPYRDAIDAYIKAYQKGDQAGMDAALQISENANRRRRGEVFDRSIEDLRSKGNTQLADQAAKQRSYYVDNADNYKTLINGGKPHSIPGRPAPAAAAPAPSAPASAGGSRRVRTARNRRRGRSANNAAFKTGTASRRMFNNG